MKIFTNVFSAILLVITFITLILLIISAYSSYLDPEIYPILSNAGMGFPIILILHTLLFVFLLFVKKIYAIFSFIGFVAVWCQFNIYMPINRHITPPENSIKFLSYNIMNFNGLKKDSQGENSILNYLVNSKADIICLQEYAETNNKNLLTKKEIKEALKEYPYSSISTVGDKGSNNQLACFSKFPIKSAKKVAYSSAYNGSIAYIIHIEGEDFLIINNHFESNKITKEDRIAYERLIKGKEKDKMLDDTKGLASKIIDASVIRKHQADSVVNLINKSSFTHTIACGDFNDSPLSYTNRVLEEYLTNAYVSSGRGLGISYNQNKFYFRIDNILVSDNLKAYNCTVDKSIKTSDHYPIWCYIAKQ